MKADFEANNTKINYHLSSIIPKSGIILDVGASRGEFATQISGVLPTSRIFSFEPLPTAFEDLMKVAEKFPNITPINSAISSQNGTTTFYENQGDKGSSLLRPLEGQPSQWLTPKRQISVKTQRLEQFMREREVTSVSLLKSDAQGADLEVVLSAGAFLNPKHIAAILIEINFVPFYHQQNNYFDIFSSLDKQGYRLAWLYPTRDYQEWLWCADCLFIDKDA